jgi:hypothetical protein
MDIHREIILVEERAHQLGKVRLVLQVQNFQPFVHRVAAVCREVGVTQNMTAIRNN